MKSSKVSIKTRSASLSFKGQATKHTTVKWSIQQTTETYSPQTFSATAAVVAPFYNYKGLNITSEYITFPLANVYDIALGRRSIIKTYSVRLHMEDSFRT